MINTDFGALFITNTAEKKAAGKNTNIIQTIDPVDCVNWRYADRQNFEMGDLQELANNIAENGQVQPIIVRLVNNKYEVIAGERRWRACALINKNIKAIIMQLSDEDAFILQSAENIKQELSNYSKSMSYYKILSDEKLSQRTLAKKIGMSKSTLNNLLAFAGVSNDLWHAVGDMRKVTIKTACFIKQLLENNPELLNKFIEISHEIQKGAGTNKLKKLLQQQEIINTKDIYRADNKLLLKINNNNIILPINNLINKDLDEFINYIKKYFHEN